jgi:hypothetical protein
MAFSAASPLLAAGGLNLLGHLARSAFVAHVVDDDLRALLAQR